MLVESGGWSLLLWWNLRVKNWTDFGWAGLGVVGREKLSNHLVPRVCLRFCPRFLRFLAFNVALLEILSRHCTFSSCTENNVNMLPRCLSNGLDGLCCCPLVPDSVIRFTKDTHRRCAVERLDDTLYRFNSAFVCHSDGLLLVYVWHLCVRGMLQTSSR